MCGGDLAKKKIGTAHEKTITYIEKIWTQQK